MDCAKTESASLWRGVLSFAGAMAACGVAMYCVSRISEGERDAGEVDEEMTAYPREDEEEEEYDIPLEYPQPDTDFDFHLDDEDMGNEELPSSIVQSMMVEHSSDENSQTENSTGSGLSWTQTEEEVMLEFHIPSHIKAKNINCKFNTNTISVHVDDESLLVGNLYMPIQPDGCSWEIDGSGQGRLLLVSLLKSPLSPGFWAEVIKSSDD